MLVLDKPRGITSQAAVNTVNRLLKARRAGHTGTLDPFATGVLPICVNSATKIIPFMVSGNKKYEAEMRLGVKTDTLDLTGRVTGEKEIGIINNSELLGVFSKFRGKINQVPPMYSALKKDGVRLYEYARRGIDVPRAERTVIIDALELLDFNPPFVRFMVECSRGTYIRVLASDIADELGCGGHLTELRRIESDGFSIDDAVTIEDIRNGSVSLTPLDHALSHMRRVEIGREAACNIREGKQITKSSLDRLGISRFESGERVMICEGDTLVAISEAVMDSAETEDATGGEVVFRLLRVFN
ncbi:MAG TPA: tRNA pseudouridine(55) synthase TruB [Thermodesulfobacteriota bacterium]|nr:tRNA pseudouridine(55) synthase TruB [Thermodesulfobacteriota bacterium]